MVSNSERKPNHFKMGAESDLSLESVILLILGLFGVLFGLLLFKIHTGGLPYSPDSTYGLFLVIVSFQVITMGKTPFGDLRRSWALVISGMCAAVLGMAACFIPGYLTEPVRVLVGVILLAGGISLCIRLFVSDEKAKLWMRISGILRHLTFACSLVYALTIVLGLVTLLPGLTTNPQTALVLIVYGLGFFYLSWCIHKAARSYPSEHPNNSASIRSKAGGCFFRDASLSLVPAILVLLGLLLAFLGLLLFPVNLGMLRFSPDGQLGLLLTVMAIQMTALGDTPLGQYKRSWSMVILGLVFAALGVVSCIVPGMLTGMIQVLLGVLNVVGGSLLLIKRFYPKLRDKSSQAAPVFVLPVLKKLALTQTVLNLVTIAFGITMLAPGIVSGFLIAGILVVNGLLLFVLAAILQKLAGLQAGGEAAVLPG